MQNSLGHEQKSLNKMNESQTIKRDPDKQQDPLRDLFALSALEGLISVYRPNGGLIDEYVFDAVCGLWAKQAYRIADAMLAEKRK